jgi:hypothetical protein
MRLLCGLWCGAGEAGERQRDERRDREREHALIFERRERELKTVCSFVGCVEMRAERV